MWREVLGPACLSVDHPRYLSFIPSAATKASAAFDMLVGATSMHATAARGWRDRARSTPENQALRWLADLAGFPAPVRAASSCRAARVGNLSALVAAREAARTARSPPGHAPAATVGGLRDRADALLRRSHALQVVMDVDVIQVPGDERGRLTGPANCSGHRGRTARQ